MERTDSSAEKPSAKQFPWGGLILLGLPLVLAGGVLLTFLFHAVGIHQRQGPALSSLIAIVVGTRLVLSFQDAFRNPSRRLIICGILAAVLVVVVVGLRLTNVIPPPD
jgi:hypothetical protein